MGVPGLYTLLHPYTSKQTFSPPTCSSFCTSADRPETTENVLDLPKEKRYELFIDGPGLAYHVYNHYYSDMKMGKDKEGKGNPFKAVTEYDEFVRNVGRWLERLEDCFGSGSIKKIYFDGYLPPSKQPTRIYRLEDSLRQLLVYHNAHPSHIPSSSSKPNKLFIPAPPFIVSTTLSYLNSVPRWRGAEKSIIEVVPGEADGWCAVGAMHAGALRSENEEEEDITGIVITGDSDLYLYDETGSDGHDNQKNSVPVTDWGVIMFRDLEFFEVGESERPRWEAKADIFCPMRISQSLLGDVELELITPTSTGAVPTSPLPEPSGGSGTKTKKKKLAGYTIDQKLGNDSPNALSKQNFGPEQSVVRATTLVGLAYHLQNEPGAPIAKLKSLARDSAKQLTSRREKEFRRQYDVSPILRSVEISSGIRESTGRGGVDIDSHIRKLDPRISELVFQLPCQQCYTVPLLDTQEMKERADRNEIVLECFLPFLYEDPTRASAWDVGRGELRDVAYTFLEAYQRLSDGDQERRVTVTEYTRRGNRIGAITVGKEKNCFLKDYMKFSMEVDTEWPWWIGLLMHLLMGEHCCREQTMKSELSGIAHMLLSKTVEQGNRKMDTLWTWPFVHLFAQVQAAVYSLWLLKQLVPFALVAFEKGANVSGIDLLLLSRMLEEVPPIEKTLNSEFFLAGIGGEKTGSGLEEIIVESVLKRWRDGKDSENESEGRENEKEMWDGMVVDVGFADLKKFMGRK